MKAAADAALVESMVQQLRDCVSVGDEMTLDHATLMDDAADWIAGEPARLAAAREEQREADALALLALADPECSCAQEEDVCAACEVDGYARVIRATPLTATPLVRDPGPTEATCKTT